MGFAVIIGRRGPHGRVIRRHCYDWGWRYQRRSCHDRRVRRINCRVRGAVVAGRALLDRALVELLVVVVDFADLFGSGAAAQMRTVIPRKLDANMEN